jgi:hypothetical protein
MAERHPDRRAMTITRKRLLIALGVVVLALAVVSLVLPYIGGGSNGISPIP